VLWEPVTSSDRYFREVFRAATIRDLREGVSAQPTGELLQRLKDKGTVDVLGYSVHRNLHDSAQQCTLEEELGTTPRDVLLVQLSRTSELRAAYRKLVESLYRNHLHVEVEAIQAKEAWWFSNDPSRSSSVTEAVIRSTVSWLIARLDPQLEPAGA
jgi:hypothetical protein